MTLSVKNAFRTIACAALLTGGALYAIAHDASASSHYGSGAGAGTTVVDAAIASPDHETLVTAVQAAGLVETLQGEGPFTVFAPVDEAFEQLPEGTLDSLLQPENRDQLTAVLTYHVVAGNVTGADLMQQAQANGGSVSVDTVQGGELTVEIEGSGIVIVDAAGNRSHVIAGDLAQSNGVIHVIDTVLLPM